MYTVCMCPTSYFGGTPCIIQVMTMTEHWNNHGCLGHQIESVGNSFEISCLRYQKHVDYVNAANRSLKVYIYTYIYIHICTYTCVCIHIHWYIGTGKGSKTHEHATNLSLLKGCLFCTKWPSSNVGAVCLCRDASAYSSRTWRNIPQSPKVFSGEIWRRWEMTRFGTYMGYTWYIYI